MRSFLLYILGLSLFITSCGTVSLMNKESHQRESPSPVSGKKIEEGVASWYGPNFHGNLTANGETYDMYGLTAAHRTLPFNSVVRVKNLNNGNSVQVRINDRGPFAKNRIIDLSKKAAQELEMIGPGTAKVQLYLVKGDLANSRTTNLKVASFTVQLASYAAKEKARNHAQKIPGSRIETVHLEDDTFYRVYYGTYVDKAKARKKQKQLQREGIVGYVKQIEN